MPSNQPTPHGLTDLQLKFCIHYATSLNASRAYVAAGYKVLNNEVAASSASTLLKNPKIRAYLGEILNFNQAIAINRLVCIALGEVTDAVNISTKDLIEDDRQVQKQVTTITDSDTWSDRTKKAVKSIKSTKDGIIVEFHDPVAAIDKLLKMKAFQVDEPKMAAIEMLDALHRLGMLVPGQIEAIGKNLENMDNDLKALGEVKPESES